MIDNRFNVVYHLLYLVSKKLYLMKKLYRPTKIEIKDTEHGGFKVVDSENDDYQLATILEFKPENSDLPIEETREFVQYLIEYYNHNYS